ncbi:MAG: heme o synthase [Myxococcota bacterium]
MSQAPHTASAPAAPRSLRQVVGDYAALTKPSITRMCLLMTAAGLWLAPEVTGWVGLIGALLGTAMAVGSANALNMWWEREPDRRMARTKRRPVAAGRMHPRNALVFGVTLGVVSLGVLATTTNLLTAALGAFALVSYVAVYTPLKYRTPLALIIGAVPGAMPPLMGWTAASNRIDEPALVLFGILLLWQLPHFLAISLYRKKDYARAGIRVVPIVRGDEVARRQAVAWTTALLPVSLLLTPLGVTGTLYLMVALGSGLGFLAWSLTGLRAQTGPRWARNFFLASLAYLPLLTIAFVLDRLLLA